MSLSAKRVGVTGVLARSVLWVACTGAAMQVEAKRAQSQQSR